MPSCAFCAFIFQLDRSGRPVECKMSDKICAAFGFNNYQNDKDKHELSFFRLPRDKERYVFNALFHFCRVDWVVHRKTLPDGGHAPTPASGYFLVRVARIFKSNQAFCPHFLFRGRVELRIIK